MGDLVGDCVGSSADIFESIAAEIIGAMILGGTLAQEARVGVPASFMFFPVIIHAFDIVVSSIGVMSLRAPRGDDDPMTILKRGYFVSAGLAMVGFVFACWWLLSTPAAPRAWLHFVLCGFVGMVTSIVFIKSTQYYTDYAYPPVRDIARASESGHGTNIIAGVGVGMRSTAIPIITVSIAVLVAYHTGRTSGMCVWGEEGALVLVVRRVFLCVCVCAYCRCDAPLACARRTGRGRQRGPLRHGRVHHGHALLGRICACRPGIRGRMFV